MGQLSFLEPEPRLPEGFRYQPDLLTAMEEEALLHHVRALPFREFEFHGFTGKRRVVSFGWKYDFSARTLQKVSDIPGWLAPLRRSAARFAGLDDLLLVHALVTEYSPGAAIGWHKDRDEFGDVLGVSLLSECSFRLRRRVSTGWERVNLPAEPRSVYLMTGAARSEWEHSIPPVDSLRYSVTFRNLRADLRGGATPAR